MSNDAITTPNETDTTGPLILIVNPNSSQSITDAISASLDVKNVSVEYMTGPSSSVEAINDEEGALISAEACLPLLVERMNQPNPPNAVLVACYSDHPLVGMLKKEISRPELQVMGIFEASVESAVKTIKPGEKFGIVTTGKAWEPLLTDGVHQILGEMDDAEPDCFAGVIGTGLGVLEFHGGETEAVHASMSQAAQELVTKGAMAICLGCAGMSGLDVVIAKAVNEEDHPDRIKVIDGVKAGVELLKARLS
ncbi:hypothetical protein FRC14_000502 [Serendipita sp. 396]|nr:hypothetical protein FRC14_000502 [Serendipita sp. 396]KAG8775412.1 hypothetical protein FRC15_000531 [Serendipita sp. 397]KAG8791387.1 hypothetical protein FRC16_000434 [Serendipita sp. 398]KAG8812070.1 hypothetical protein FRC18_003109 [Serendipita sp. 400]KAG8817607.1 hypothetical protein FRC19_011266 [Serendipita sp. 401]KAG8846984.1 hypothetical protein FRB91_000303 [Serendipita sp. 411]KAG8856162.1 hypothetical protein FRC20_000537 [Serendipita sp. 405]KAG9054959.1 hypothetical prot